MPVNWNQVTANDSAYMQEFSTKVKNWSNGNKQRQNELYSGSSNEGDFSTKLVDEIMMRAGGDSILSPSYAKKLYDMAPLIRSQHFLNSLGGFENYGGGNQSGTSRVADANSFGGFLADWLAPQSTAEGGPVYGYGYYTPERARTVWDSVMARAKSANDTKRKISNGQTVSADENAAYAPWMGILDNPERMQDLFSTYLIQRNPTFARTALSAINKDFKRYNTPENIKASGGWLDWFLGINPVNGGNTGATGPITGLWDVWGRI